MVTWHLFGTFVFHGQVVAVKKVTLAHTVRINKQEANLAERVEKCLDLSFLNIFNSTLYFAVIAILKNGNFQRSFA